jgi:non-specific serine/threonine protein kinase
MAALHALIEQDRARLVTLTGAGGSGKTRLAVELASELSSRFDRAWFVDLSLISGADLVPSAVAQAIGVQEGGSRELVAIVREMLSVGRFLLILDNFEHVLEAGTFVTQLLASSRDLVVAVTSRETLSLRAEHVFVVDPLPTPQRGQLDDIAALRQFPSLQLFEERARAANSNFQMSDDTVPIIAEICLELDGLPLAIELVAAQSRVLSPREILARLVARAPLVTSGPRDIPERHRTLDATVSWSYALLTEPEQGVFRICGVFAGGFSLDAVSAVQREFMNDGDVLATLSQLVSKNLVRVTHHADGTSRYWLLDTIRAYALRRLSEAGELDLAQRAHARHYVEFAEGLQASMRGPGMAKALDRLALEYNNFRLVFQWSTARQELEFGLRLAGALYRFWIARGHLAEARGWLEPALAEGNGAPPRVRALAFNAAGVMAGMQHDHERAVDFFTESLKLWTELGDLDRQAAVSLNLGLVALNLGELEKAEAQFDRAYQLNVQTGDRGGQANALGNRARIARDRGDLQLALELFERCVTLFRELGDDWGTANSLANLGHVFLGLGDTHNAEQAFRESLEIRRALGNVLHIAESLEGLAAVMASDRPRIAVRLLGAAESMRDQSGAPVPADEQVRYSDLVASVRSGLSPTMFRVGWTAGRTLSVNGAVDLAFEQPGDEGLTAAAPHALAEESTGELDGLSARERDIALLIAQGCSNRQIAERLVLSVKTVETHLKHIFVKLNVRSRAAVAAIASRATAA